jgi:hypothetical protein
VVVQYQLHKEIKMVECPKEYYECLTYEEFDEIVDILEENDLPMPEAMSDAEAAANFVWQVLFLNPIELIYIGITMTVLATYGLSIYYMFKKIQKKFS